MFVPLRAQPAIEVTVEITGGDGAPPTPWRCRCQEMMVHHCKDRSASVATKRGVAEALGGGGEADARFEDLVVSQTSFGVHGCAVRVRMGFS